MKTVNNLKNPEIFSKIRAMSNPLRFNILELTQHKDRSISDLSSNLRLSYTKCADYVKMLEDLQLVSKTKVGKEVKVRSRVIFSKSQVVFQY
jgi:predicted transcriptional regulator